MARIARRQSPTDGDAGSLRGGYWRREVLSQEPNRTRRHRAAPTARHSPRPRQPRPSAPAACHRTVPPALVAGVIVAALLAAASGRREARVLIRVPGAHWASPHHPRRIAWLTLAASLLTVLVAAPGAAATGSTTSSTSTATTLTTTAIDRPWYTTEQFYVGLANCTRTGGWVLSDGTCRGYGTGHYSAYVRPFRVSTLIADRVARPYAKLLAVRNLCSHYADSDPAHRLRRAGLYDWTWGENIGCRYGYSTAKAAILASHLAMQSEKSTNGGHWKNLKNPRFTWIGVGIWGYSSRMRLVTDFYG